MVCCTVLTFQENTSYNKKINKKKKMTNQNDLFSKWLPKRLISVLKMSQSNGRRRQAGGGGGGGDEREEITFQFLSTFPKYVVNKSIALGLKGRS